jgi:predicted phage terminase large subunit-like protein
MMTKLTKEQKQAVKMELARREFFSYCNVLAPDFYKKDREYLVGLCNDMQDFYESDEEVLIVNAPPRHGKSRTASLFTSWVLGKNSKEKVMTGSYNETLSTTFSKGVRNQIQEIKADTDRTVFSDIFPDVTIKRGDGAMNLWSLNDGYNNYLATSPTGTATGFGASLMIIDDLIKLAEEAVNENVLNKHWDWFTNTMLSRLEEGGKIIVIMTRWATNDLAGRVLEWCKAYKKRYRHVSLKAHLGNGEMLCPDVLSYEGYLGKITAMSKEIVAANYDQEPMDIVGRLYQPFKTYAELPKDKATGNLLTKTRYAYTDTADQGKDYLCQFIWTVYNKEAYILDAIYTKEPATVTEPMMAVKLTENEVDLARYESNSGGSLIARNVMGHLEKMKNFRTVVKWFHQSKNKKARIISNQSWLQEHVYFPVGWENRWPDLYKALMSYQREGENTNDDAPDALSGVSETMLLRHYE